MLIEHFKLTALPFSEKPEPKEIFRHQGITQGLARLEYFLQDGVVALLLGATGVGKSSLLRLFLDSLSRHHYHPLYLHLTHVQAPGLLRLLVSALGEKPRLGKDRLFLQILDKTQRTERTTLLLIDEAHLLTPEALTDLRLLVSSGLDTPPLKLLFCGQEPLQGLLARSSHTDLAHRIRVRLHLRPFTEEETLSYLDFRLRRAGASDKLFEPEAKRLIHHYAGGIPRQINNLATACLLNAVARSVQKVPEALVNDTLGELHLP